MAKIPVKTVTDTEKGANIPVEDQAAPVDETTQPAEAADIKSSDESQPQETEISEASSSDAHDALEVEVMEEAEEAEELEELDEFTLLTRRIKTQEQEISEHYEARLRLQAEFDNFKKRKEKESADFRKYANASLLEDVLLVVDDFERAIAAAEQSNKLEDFLQGVDMIFNKFVDTLKKKGVKEIEAEAGQVFNPAMHEAVTQIETDEFEEGAIAAVFQKGYYLHERVLRAPKVAVAKPKN